MGRGEQTLIGLNLALAEKTVEVCKELASWEKGGTGHALIGT